MAKQLWPDDIKTILEEKVFGDSSIEAPTSFTLRGGLAPFRIQILKPKEEDLKTKLEINTYVEAINTVCDVIAEATGIQRDHVKNACLGGQLKDVGVLNLYIPKEKAAEYVEAIIGAAETIKESCVLDSPEANGRTSDSHELDQKGSLRSIAAVRFGFPYKKEPTMAPEMQAEAIHKMTHDDDYSMQEWTLPGQRPAPLRVEIKDGKMGLADTSAIDSQNNEYAQKLEKRQALIDDQKVRGVDRMFDRGLGKIVELPIGQVFERLSEGKHVGPATFWDPEAEVFCSRYDKN